MKKTILPMAFVAILSTAVYFASCKKNATDVNSNVQNERLTANSVQTSNFPTTVISLGPFTDIRVSAVADSTYKVIRKVEYINKATKQVVGAFITELTSTNLPIVQAIKNKNFDGNEIIHDAQNNMVTKKIIKASKVISSNTTTKLKIELEYGGGDPCSFSYIHACVAKKIDDMNWAEYGICLLSAPECYGGLYVICAVDCGTVPAN